MAEKQPYGGRKRKKAAELRECLLALLEQPFPVTDENGEPECDGHGAPLLRTGAQLQSEALFRRALKDTKSFEVLRSAVASKDEKPGKGERGDGLRGAQDISDETEAAVLRAVREAVRDAEEDRAEILTELPTGNGTGTDAAEGFHEA